MGKGQRKGFTIIETTLVLSISALLAVGMMIGWSANLNRKRYEDSVTTFKTDIEAIFDEVRNTTNSRTSGTCSDGSDIVTLNKTVNSGAGTTDCLVLGKLISFSDASGYGAQHKFVTWDLIGLDKDYSSYENSIEAIKGSKITVDISTRSENTLEWDANMLMATDNRRDIFRDPAVSSTPGFNIASWTYATVTGVAIVRSPLDGNILTFGLIRALNTGGHVHARILQQQADAGHLLSAEKTVNICVRPFSRSWMESGLAYGKNKVIKISGGGNPVEIAPLDGPGSMSCDGTSRFMGAVSVDGSPL